MKLKVRKENSWESGPENEKSRLLFSSLKITMFVISAAYLSLLVSAFCSTSDTWLVMTPAKTQGHDLLALVSTDVCQQFCIEREREHLDSLGRTQEWGPDLVHTAVTMGLELVSQWVLQRTRTGMSLVTPSLKTWQRHWMIARNPNQGSLVVFHRGGRLELILEGRIKIEWWGRRQDRLGERGSNRSQG